MSILVFVDNSPLPKNGGGGGILKIMKTRDIKLDPKGFTLIELLVVISIIGLLASIVVVAVNPARGKSRDAKRLSDMHQLKLAIEMYYDANGVYPTCTGAHPSVCISTVYASYGDIRTLGIAPTYVSVVPLDPINANGEYGYYYARGHKKTGPNSWSQTGSSSDYIIGTRLETSMGGGTYSGWDNSNLNYLDGN